MPINVKTIVQDTKINDKYAVFVGTDYVYYLWDALVGLYSDERKEAEGLLNAVPTFQVEAEDRTMRRGFRPYVWERRNARRH